MIARYEVPNQEVLNLIKQGRHMKAMLVWLLLPHKLLNGVRIRPRASVARTMLKSVELGIHKYPMCICEGDYSIVE